MIKCGFCGELHPTVSDVSRCSGTLPEPRPGPLPDYPAASASALVENVNPVVLDPDWKRLAGPVAFGRNLIISRGAEVPPPWQNATVVSLDDPDTALSALQSLRDARGAAVIVADELPSVTARLTTDYWNLDPYTELDGERLHHLVVSHAVDARDLAAPTIDAVSLAVHAGAKVSTVADVDIDGVPHFCDGGPLHIFDTCPLGAPIIPAANLALGTLRAVGSAPPDAALAPDQLEAVAHQGAGARIIAPAGSGKTRVLTERARHLIRERGIDPRAICLLAYNVRAREEMEDRTADLVGLEIRTLNSLGLAILSGSGSFAAPAGRSRPQVITELEIRELLDKLVKVKRRAMADPMAAWIEALRASRLGLRDPAEVEQEFAGDIKNFAILAPEFRKRLQRANLVDFDEQILAAVEVLCTDPGARKQARLGAQIVLVDEFQDLTPAHVLLIRLLAGPAANVFGVGDDDQTIYGYSSASPDWLIDFSDLFPGARNHDLSINYRCSPAVVNGAATLLSHNRRRIPKEIKPRPGRAAADGGLSVKISEDPTTITTEHVVSLISSGVRPADIAVLTRVNATLLGPMLALADAGIDTNAPIDQRFLVRTGVAGALAWLRLATAPAQALPHAALETAARRPPRALRRSVTDWIGEKSNLREIRDLASRLPDERDQDKVAGFVDDLIALRKLAEGADTKTVLLEIRDTIGLGAVLDQRLDASRRSVDRSAHGDDLAVLIAVARQQPDPEAFPDWLARQLSTAKPNWRGVLLSTIHKVKGREWPHVIVHNAVNGLMPHRLASDKEEERRIFHVAITRSSAQTLVVAGEPASPFVAQLFTPHDPNEPGPVSTSSSAPTKQPAKKTSTAPPVPEAATRAEALLRERLRAWRLEQAKADGVPAFLIFYNLTLYDLARQCPLDDDALLGINGIGPVKVKKYGPAILSIIAEARRR